MIRYITQHKQGFTEIKVNSITYSYRYELEGKLIDSDNPMPTLDNLVFRAIKLNKPNMENVARFLCSTLLRTYIKTYPYVYSVKVVLRDWELNNFVEIEYNNDDVQQIGE